MAIAIDSGKKVIFVVISMTMMAFLLTPHAVFFSMDPSSMPTHHFLELGV